MESNSDEDYSDAEVEREYYVYEEEQFNRNLQMVKYDPRFKKLYCCGLDDDFVQNITTERWEEIGRDLSNSSLVEELHFICGALNDHKISFLFRGLTRSRSLNYLRLFNNEITVAGVRSLVPFLQSANNLRRVNLRRNNILSEGFHMIIRTLHDTLIQSLNCSECGIESIQIDIDHFPRHLKTLILSGNKINSGGCQEIAKLLQGRDSTLTYLDLEDNEIDDEGVDILVNALRSNTSLGSFLLSGNDGISKKGLLMLLQLVVDISSVKATIQSNHTLTNIMSVPVNRNSELSSDAKVISFIHQIYRATRINRDYKNNSGGAARGKVIETQLYSGTRAVLAELQGVSQSLYSEINPLHLPEVLSLVGRSHGQGELYVALKSSIAEVISTVNRKACLQQRRDYHAAILARHTAILEELDSELAQLDADAKRDVVDVSNASRSNKRCRKY